MRKLPLFVIIGALLLALFPLGMQQAAAQETDDGGGGDTRGATPMCIEGDYVQENGQNEHVGNVFPGGPDWVIVSSGPTTCTFNCLDGFDVNCDGKIGDYCPVELDRSLVNDVKPCLEALNPSVAAAAPAAPAAAPAAIAVGSTSLAYTGTETTFAMFGVALLSVGALAVGASRRSRRSPIVDEWLDR